MAVVPLVTPWPSVRQALIRRLRANLVLADGLRGDWSEGFAPLETDYPLGVLSLHFAPSFYDWTGRVTVLGVDVLIWSETQDEADRLYQLAFTSLQDAFLTLAGQTSLKCRQSSDLSLPDVDAKGEAIFSTGGVFEVIVAQSNPDLSTIVFTADSTIS